MGVSGTPGAGSITIGSAKAGFLAFGAGDDGLTFDVFITDVGNAWEIAQNCTYTNSTTALTRGTFISSSTGSVLTLTSAAVVTVTLTAEKANTFLTTSVTSPSTGQVIEYNGSSWVNATLNYSSLTGAPTTYAWASLTGVPTTMSGYGISAVAWGLITGAPSFITGNQAITVTGDASGGGSTNITLTLSSVNGSPGTYNNSSTTHTPFTVNAKGLLTSTGSEVTLTPAFTSITGKPTTLAGYGVTSSDTLIPLNSGNVTLTTPSSNQLLQFNGTNWVNATVSSGGGSPDYVSYSYAGGL